MWESLAMFVVAFAVSAFGTVVGFGGGVFMVPILTLIFPYPDSNGDRLRYPCSFPRGNDFDTAQLFEEVRSTLLSVYC